MAEILFKALDATHSDPEKDRKGCYKRGMPVVVMPDGHVWGTEERLPKFVVLKFPLTPVASVLKFIERQFDDNGVLVRRRLWQLRWADLPNPARNRLANTGQLIIKANPAYNGDFDYTWTQVKQYFRNLKTGLDETGDL